MFRAIHSHEVHDELTSLKTKKSSIDSSTEMYKASCKQLLSYLEKEKILYEFQFGFTGKGHSTSQAITEIAENLRKAVDNNMYSCGVFFRLLQSFRYC